VKEKVDQNAKKPSDEKWHHAGRFDGERFNQQEIVFFPQIRAARGFCRNLGHIGRKWGDYRSHLTEQDGESNPVKLIQFMDVFFLRDPKFPGPNQLVEMNRRWEHESTRAMEHSRGPASSGDKLISHDIPWLLLPYLPSGKRLHNYGKSQLLMGKLTINGHFH